MQRRILGLVAGHLVLTAALAGLGRAAGAGLLGPTHPQGTALAVLVGCYVAFTVVGLAPVHVELRRSACTITLVEAVVAVALLHLGPFGVVLAAAGGEVAACTLQRQSSLKVAYNTAATALAATVAGLAFLAAGGGHADPAEPSSWLAAALAVLAFAATNMASTAVVLAVVEGRRLHSVVVSSLPTATVAATVSLSIGLVGHGLLLVAPWAPALLVPLAVLVAQQTRAVARHRAEHLRFQRLYEAQARTSVLDAVEDALGRSAEAARELVTGSAAVCCAADRTGRWHAVLVDDDGARTLEPHLAATVAAMATASGRRERDADDLPVEACPGLPRARSVVTAVQAPAEGTTGAALLVLRDVAPDGQGDARAEVLAAFLGHAALTATNARLYAEVGEALAHQVDLNRQKDEFLASVSHELRTPLASVLASVSTLQRLDDRMQPSQRERFFAIAQTQGKRLERLIEELLLTAAVEHRQGPAVLLPVDAAVVAGEVASELAEVAGDRVVVRAAAGAQVASDEQKLRQLLVNLVDNAAKYAPSGPIELVLEPSPSGEHVRVAVVDHGPGIAPEDRDRVFERFVQLDQSSTRTRGGTGLGLYLCRQIGDLLGDGLRLEETPGGGCTFSLLLPALGASRPSRASA